MWRNRHMRLPRLPICRRGSGKPRILFLHCENEDHSPVLPACHASQTSFDNISCDDKYRTNYMNPTRILSFGCHALYNSKYRNAISAEVPICSPALACHSLRMSSCSNNYDRTCENADEVLIKSGTESDECNDEDVVDEYIIKRANSRNERFDHSVSDDAASDEEIEFEYPSVLGFMEDADRSDDSGESNELIDVHSPVKKPMSVCDTTSGVCKFKHEHHECTKKDSDFYDEIRVSDDAGLPLIPRSLLDLKVEEIMEQTNEQGHCLWKKFKEAAARKPPFVCKDVINSWLAEGNVASRSAVVYIALVFRSWKKNKRALEVFNWIMSEKPFEMTDMDYAIQIDLISRVHGVQVASKHYAKIPRDLQTTMVYSVLLASYLDSKMEKHAERLISRARKWGLPQQVILYNQMLNYYKGKGKISVVGDVLKEMEVYHIDVDLYTYNIILDLRARKGDVTGMRNIWKCLENDKNVQPDAASYAILARGYINADLLGKAQKAIQEVESGYCKRKQVVYRWLLKLYAELNREDELERVWGLLSSTSTVLVDDYSIMIEALGKVGEVERAEKMFSEVVDRFGIKRLHQYNALLSIYLTHGMLEKAESLVTRMSKESMSPGPSTYHQLIVMYASTGNEDKAMEIFRRAKDAQKTLCTKKPWYVSYLAMVEMFGDKGDVENAELIIKELRNDGYPCGYKMYCGLLKAYVKSNTTPYGFLERMHADGAIPNSYIRSELDKLNGT